MNAAILTAQIKAESHSKVKSDDKANLTIHRCYFGDEDDLSLDEESIAAGWSHHKTCVDSAVHGVWINQCLRMLLCFCEGDWTLLECADDESFKQTFDRMDSFYKGMDK